MFQVNSLQEYLKFMERYSSYEAFFRGQKKEFPSISPTIARDGYISHESQIFHEARMLGQKQFEGINTPLEFLSKMQHYEFPTRLIDVSIDPVIALYFAVEEYQEKNSGFVYAYVPKRTFSFDDKNVQLLSILATIDNYDFDVITKTFLQQFGTKITQSEIETYSHESVFLKYSEQLKKSNERLFNQKGSFFLCGNAGERNCISHEILTLDSIKPMVVVRIPFEYKTKIRNELDNICNINSIVIYPELPSIASYLKEKYKKRGTHFSPEGKYEILKQGTPSFNKEKLFLDVVLLEKIPIDDVKLVAEHVTQSFENDYSHIRVDIAQSESDIISNNWLLQSEWIKPGFTPKLIQFDKHGKDEKGYFWSYGEQYEVMTDYFDEFFFEDDSYLLICHEKIFDDIYPMFCKMQQTFKTGTFKHF